jgi:hypothetical protein
LPPKFKMPQVKAYGGNKDPLDIETYTSVGSFKYLEKQFLSLFINGRKRRKNRPHAYSP